MVCLEGESALFPHTVTCCIWRDFAFYPVLRTGFPPSPKRKSPPKPTEIEFEMACLCLAVYKSLSLVFLGGIWDPWAPPSHGIPWVAPSGWAGLPQEWLHCPGFWPGWIASGLPLNKHLPSPLLGWWSNWIMPFCSSDYRARAGGN